MLAAENLTVGEIDFILNDGGNDCSNKAYKEQLLQNENSIQFKKKLSGEKIKDYGRKRQ